MMARRSEGLGERPVKILQFLAEYQEKHGYSPSIREIGKHIGVDSTSLVDYYLDQLSEKGFIERDNRVSRSIRVLKAFNESSLIGKAAGAVRQAVSEVATELFSIPLVGRIGASLPIPMPDTSASYFDAFSSVEIARSLLPTREKLGELFALEVDGVSMIDAMVNDGDIVIMKRTSTANNGEMVAVWLEDNNETTLKYFYKENGKVRLQPANPTMSPIIIDNPEQVRIQGKVVMVVRQFKTQ
jgi:repressor LexA